MTDILVAPVCTGNILFHTGNADVSQEQNFFPFLSYPSHLREKTDLVLKLPNLLNQQTQIFPWDWVLYEDTSYEEFHQFQVPPHPKWGVLTGIFLAAQKINFLTHYMRDGFGSCLRLYPSTVLSCPSLPAGHLPRSKWPHSPGTSHTRHHVELLLSHVFIHKTQLYGGDRSKLT